MEGIENGMVGVVSLKYESGTLSNMQGQRTVKHVMVFIWNWNKDTHACTPCTPHTHRWVGELTAMR